MRIALGGVLLACSVASFAMPGLGQSTLVPRTSVQRASHPYTAKFQITTEQTLANGTTITRESTEIQMMDSQGRRLTATSFPAMEQVPERTSFHVYDPVERTNANWMVPGKSANVQRMPPPPEPGQTRTCWTTTEQHGSTTVPISPDRAAGAVTGSMGGSVTSVGLGQQRSNTNETTRNETTREDLGTQTIQGVVATGTRTTRTTPTGAEGNDAPLVHTSEVWMAKSIGLVVREVTDDPRTGKRTKELVELSQSEPDPSAFQPPEGYEVLTGELREVPCQH